MDVEPQEPTTTTGGSVAVPDPSRSPSWMASPDPAVDHLPQTVHGTPAPNKGRTGLVIAAVVLVAVTGAVLGVVGGPSGSHPSTSPAPSGSANGIVLTALDSTLGARTAGLHITISVNMPGTGQVTASGDGAIDFTNDEARLIVDYHGLPSLDGTTMTVLYVGGSGYLSMPQVSTLIPGKSWIGIPTGATSVAPGSSDPAAIFQILRAQGDIVTSLGPTGVNGTPVHGYHVVITSAGYQKALSQGNLPAGMARSVHALLGSGGLTMDVYVNDTTGMLARMVADVSLNIAGQPVTDVITEDVSTPGVPVDVTAPPPDQVASLQQLSQAIGSLGSSAG